MTGSPAIVTSWDDGHPSDLRLADLLMRHGLRGTFFVPGRNVEGRATMTAPDIARLAKLGFEIAAHTADHVRLDSLDEAQAARQIGDGKKFLEDAIGAQVRGFAYPGGWPGRHGRALAAKRFDYARTTRMFRLDAGTDPFAVPTTMQFFPHGPAPLLRNLLRGGDLGTRLGPALRRIGTGDPVSATGALASLAASRDGVFHLWGHSWELDALDLWGALDQALGDLVQTWPEARRASVAEIAPCAR
jgi:hypothetical protein